MEISPREKNPIVYLAISIGGENVGKLLIELRSDVAGKTAENFRMICNSETVDEKTGEPRTYRNTIIHRALQDVHCQGGDYEKGNGTGGTSAYKDQPEFYDESFVLRHTGPGVLSMVNSGPDSNKSGFYISFAATMWLDNKHIVFGSIVGQESFEVLGKIHDVATESGEPMCEVRISDCGQVFIPPTAAAADSSG